MVDYGPWGAYPIFRHHMVRFDCSPRIASWQRSQRSVNACDGVKMRLGPLQTLQNSTKIHPHLIDHCRELA